MQKNFLKLFFITLLISGLFSSTILAASKTNIKAKPATPKATTTSTVNLNPVAPVIKEKMVLEGSDTFSIMNPTFSNDNKYLAAFFNGQKTIRIYDTQTGKTLAELGPDILYKDKFVDGMAFSDKDSLKLIVMRAEAPLKIIDWKTKKIDSEINLGISGYKINDFAFTPDKKFLALAKANGIDIWNFAESKKIKSFLDGQKINALDISSDGKFLVYAKSGKVKDSIGTIDIINMSMGNIPLANVKNENNQIPDYEVQMIDYLNGYNTIAAYLNLPAGTFKPDGPAGIFIVDTSTKEPAKSRFSGPVKLSDYRLAIAKYLPTFRCILTSSFNFTNDGKTTSAIDLINPNTMQIIKTYSSKDFKAPMLAVSISPNNNLMAAALKESEGVKLYLYTLSMPENSK